MGFETTKLSSSQNWPDDQTPERPDKVCGLMLSVVVKAGLKPAYNS